MKSKVKICLIHSEAERNSIEKRTREETYSHCCYWIEKANGKIYLMFGGIFFCNIYALLDESHENNKNLLIQDFEL